MSSSDNESPSLRDLLRPPVVDWDAVLALLTAYCACDTLNGDGVDGNSSRANPDLPSPPPLSPLLLALSKRDCPVPASVVQCLLELDPCAVSADADSHGGWTALHSACRFGASPAVVRLLVDSDPSALTITGDFGETPLHVACRYGALGEGAAAELFRGCGGRRARLASAASDSEGCVPLHYARTGWMARLLLEAHPEGAGARNEAGRMPLHEAAGGAPGAEVGVVRALLEGEERRREVGEWAGAPGALTEDNAGQTPLDCIFGAVLRGAVSDRGDRPTGLPICLMGLWRKLNVLVASVSPANCFVGQKFLSLHALVRAPHFPLDVVCLALTLEPQFALERDAWGRTPLATVASERRSPRELIEILLDPHVGCRAAAAVLDGEGRLPLHLAAKSGRHFDDGLDLILAAEPRAIGTRDITEHLFPFQLAAMGKHCNLHASFLLLKERPDVLASYCC